ncbi:hypothetical protein FBU59_001230, partial [Linderina macrospora]
MADSNVDDENYEIIDYTAASAWERFIATLEDTLLKWDLGDGRAGDFDLVHLREKCQALTVRRRQDRDSVRTELAQLCTRTQRVAFRGTAYSLTLSVHPFLATPQPNDAAGKAGKFYGLFPPIYATELEVDRGYSETDPTWHPMHRWTGSSAIVFLAYAGDEDGGWDDDLLEVADGSPAAGGNYSVSLETAKLLMSSLNIAARNVRCRLPMFVPVGDAWRFLFSGRSSDRAISITCTDNKSSISLVADTKFDSIYLAQAPSAYLQLNGLLELFAGSFNVVPYFKQPGPNGTQTAEQKWAVLASNVQLAALHVYHITNIYNRDWNQQSPDFHYRQGDLNVGPANDPLRTMRLSACFQPAPCSTYISPQPGGRDRLYLKTATAWALAVQFLPADMERTMLTEALEDAFASWAQSTSNAHRHRHLDLSDQMEAHAEITGDMLIDLFGSASGSLIQPPGTADAAESDMERRHALEERLEAVMDEVYADSTPRPLTIAQLITRMPHGAAVPCHSLLWRLCEIVLVTTTKRSADFWRAPSIMTFLRLLWAMAVREVRWRWENSEFIPKIATAAECRAARDGAASSGMDTPNASQLGLGSAAAEQASKYD